jgi:transposase-like protein
MTYGMETEPPRCPSCDATLGTVESIMAPACYVCGKPFSEGSSSAAPSVPAEPALTVPDGLDTHTEDPF